MRRRLASRPIAEHLDSAAETYLDIGVSDLDGAAQPAMTAFIFSEAFQTSCLTATVVVPSSLAT